MRFIVSVESNNIDLELFFHDLILTSFNDLLNCIQLGLEFVVVLLGGGEFGINCVDVPVHVRWSIVWAGTASASPVWVVMREHEVVTLVLQSN